MAAWLPDGPESGERLRHLCRQETYVHRVACVCPNNCPVSFRRAVLYLTTTNGEVVHRHMRRACPVCAHDTAGVSPHPCVNKAKPTGCCRITASTNTYRLALIGRERLWTLVAVIVWVNAECMCGRVGGGGECTCGCVRLLCHVHGRGRFKAVMGHVDRLAQRTVH